MDGLIKKGSFRAVNWPALACRHHCDQIPKKLLTQVEGSKKKTSIVILWPLSSSDNIHITCSEVLLPYPPGSLPVYTYILQQ